MVTTFMGKQFVSGLFNCAWDVIGKRGGKHDFTCPVWATFSLGYALK